jgi:anaerobic selenocysteine-containing dehydrogenase
VAAPSYTFGAQLYEDPNPETGAMVVWGNNVFALMGGEIRQSFRNGILGGAKLIVVDPKEIPVAKRADIWLAPRPQSDGILALGMIKAMIEEKLYNAAFVEKWTVGFDELREEVKKFSLDDVERLSWVPKDKIRKAVRMIAENQPACFGVGNAPERGHHAFQQMRAIYILQALSGNLNVPGGNAVIKKAPFLKMAQFYLLNLPQRDPAKGIGSPFKIGMKNAYVPAQLFVQTILTEKPYPIKAAFCILSDPLVSYPDTEETYRAFMKLDFFVVSELFPTPSTAVADIILPAAWQIEHDVVGYWPGWGGEIRAYPKLVDPPGEAWPDAKWMNELAKRVGLRQYFWDDWSECLDEILAPSGLTWEQFTEKRILHATKEYRKPEEGLFKTPSGKVELYAERLKATGNSPMPTFAEVSGFLFEPSDEFPLLLFNGKEAAFMLTGYKHSKIARKLKNQPTVDLHPETAEKAGLKEGDWVYIETKNGRIKQELHLDPHLDPRLVYASFGWWFPEEPEDNFQFRKSNINVLLTNAPPYDSATGSLEMGGIPCKVYKAE